MMGSMLRAARPVLVVLLLAGALAACGLHGETGPGPYGTGNYAMGSG
jgi:hypothetical protein